MGSYIRIPFSKCVQGELVASVGKDRTSMFTDLISFPQPLFQDIALALDCMNLTGCGLRVKERQGFVFLYH